MPVPPRLRPFVCVFACVLCVLCVSFLHENHEYWRILFWERGKGDCTPCLPSLSAPPPAVSLPMPPNLVCLKLFRCAVSLHVCLPLTASGVSADWRRRTPSQEWTMRLQGRKNVRVACAVCLLIVLSGKSTTCADYFVVVWMGKLKKRHHRKHPTK